RRGLRHPPHRGPARTQPTLNHHGLLPRPPRTHHDRCHRCAGAPSPRPVNGSFLVRFWLAPTPAVENPLISWAPRDSNPEPTEVDQATSTRTSLAYFTGVFSSPVASNHTDRRHFMSRFMSRGLSARDTSTPSACRAAR